MFALQESKFGKREAFFDGIGKTNYLCRAVKQAQRCCRLPGIRWSQLATANLWKYLLKAAIGMKKLIFVCGLLLNYICMLTDIRLKLSEILAVRVLMPMTVAAAGVLSA